MWKSVSIWGVFLILLLGRPHQAQAWKGFVRTQGIHFMLNGYPFFSNGFNAYWLMSIASDPSRRSKVSEAFGEAARNGLTVARTWAFSDGGSNALQYSPGVYNEQMFKVEKTHVSFSLDLMILVLGCLAVTWICVLPLFRGWILWFLRRGGLGSGLYSAW
ncbi:hypothetical protein HPP92_006167 [Vanilla planifolia]|uniref:Mannan endo-1,4-beta-mannosidase n=1 Tax=Vanilla planifolia TaxID=51239 RepID=A0A835RJU6_VANPL|nr:hypothetical protein HPP92_006167 [Vanilla planifolia]